MRHVKECTVGRWYAGLLAALSMWSWAGIIHGQTIIDWDNPAGGPYNASANWDPANVPDTDSETARFNLDAQFNVSFNANSSTTIDDLLVLQGDLLFRNGGVANDATLNITGDAILDGGNLALARTTSNADVNLVVAQLLSIDAGSELGLSDGAMVSAGSVRVGFLGTGVLRLDDQSLLENNGDARIGAGSLSDGTLTVEGGASQWMNSGDLFVGDIGNGTLHITNGGAVSNVDAIVGRSGDSTGAVTVDGAGSTWTNSGNLTVGSFGSGMLYITNGGEVIVEGDLLSAPVSPFALIRLSDGTLSVRGLSMSAGNALAWQSGTLNVTGSFGLSIFDAGPFGASLALDADQHLEVTNTLLFDNGAELFTSGGLTAGQLINNGDLILSSTAVDGPVTNNANITAIGDVTFNDQVSGPGGFFGPGTITFAGGMSPGASPAEVAFEGSVVLGSGNTLSMELGGVTPGSEHDVLSVAGSAALDGTLDVSLLGVFLPTLGETFEIITASGGVNGTFVTPAAELPALSSGLAWAINYGANNVVLSVVAAGLAGDYNENGVVDAADYTVWRDNLGSLTALPNDDTAGVGPDDYTRWVNNFGQTSGSGSGIGSNATVPEPKSAVICLMGGILLAGRVGRRYNRFLAFAASRGE
jgi:T5SS/PEP-CTERM-associated repeat protein